MIWQALMLQGGYNSVLVSLGAALLGAAAGAAGAFLTLRRRALMSDAMAHATLPGIGLAFLAMVSLGGDGRFLPGLMLGAALTAGAGLWAVQRLARQMHEDAATGAVLASFYGAGIVILTLIQGLGTGRPAGLESVLLGSTAGMLRADALVIGFGGLAVSLALWALRRPLAMVAFDPLHASMMGVNPRRMDAALMALVLAVVLVGLNVTGLILIVALLVTPAVTARMWSTTVTGTATLSALIGAACGYVGAAISASVPDLPTGPVIVLLAAGVFALTLLIRGHRDG
ncbi:metal ABC transporter permease [Pseudotabrizicola alkalilacus]|uniref:Metal ABC transporter permease n=1 Tax=Pseudotabrizicola alkalilacus TaxID=2305252 RepID=A0A411Z0V6_9RHOB|nr:metal ABC transporter permease [Pseudotabrizicola alkalilacus]RGP36668.1 metal ABC transporter permease [Pseudotabrizicola alkalilacus]